MVSTKPTSVVLTRAHRDAIFSEIEFAFECAGDLSFMLEHSPESVVDREDAHQLVTELQVAVGLLEQIGWQRSGDRDRYVIQVDEAVNRFAARIESSARAALDFNAWILANREEVSAAVRRLIDTELEKLQAARMLRTAFMIAHAAPRTTQPLGAS